MNSLTRTSCTATWWRRAGSWYRRETGSGSTLPCHHVSIRHHGRTRRQGRHRQRMSRAGTSPEDSSGVESEGRSSSIRRIRHVISVWLVPLGPRSARPSNPSLVWRETLDRRPFVHACYCWTVPTRLIYKRTIVIDRRATHLRNCSAILLYCTKEKRNNWLSWRQTMGIFKLVTMNVFRWWVPAVHNTRITVVQALKSAL